MQQPDIALAIRKYYEKRELNSQDIKELFLCGNTTSTKLKKQVLEKMAETKTRTMMPGYINTRVAYEVWGLEIEDLEARLKKMQRLGFVREAL